MNFPTDPTLQMTGSILVEVVMCNPNGDPDLRGVPRRLDDGRVWSTNASVKRVIRDELDRQGHKLYVARGTDLGDRQEEAAGMRKTDKSTQEERAEGTRRIGAEFIDVRLFGGAITRLGTRPRGPIQFAEAVSLDPAEDQMVSITRVAGSREEEEKGDKIRANMGDYTVITYAVLRGDFVFNPFDARPTAEKPGLSSEDLQAFWNALIDGWEHSRSARRAGVNPIGLVVFAAETENLRGGVEPSHVTRQRLQVGRNFDPSQGEFPRSSDSYTFSVNRENLPKGMQVYEWWAL